MTAHVHRRNPASRRYDRSSTQAQGGQALVEGAVVLLVLLSLWVAVAWLARLQEIAMAAQNAASRAAFAASRFDTRGLADSGASPFFSGPAHQWVDRGGNRLISGSDQLRAGILRGPELISAGQPGGDRPVATALRKDWRLDDLGVLDAWVVAAPGLPLVPRPARSVTGLVQFDETYPVLHRHTAILIDAGHASSDIDVQHTLQRSSQAWRNSADVSTSLGLQIGSVLEPVDSVWGRPALQLDWLSSWAGRVPAQHLSATPEVIHEP